MRQLPKLPNWVSSNIIYLQKSIKQFTHKVIFHTSLKQSFRTVRPPTGTAKTLKNVNPYLGKCYYFGVLLHAGKNIQYYNLGQHVTVVHSLYHSPIQIKSKRLRWASHVARMGEGRSSFKMLIGKPTGKSVRMDLKETRKWSDWLRIWITGEPCECGIESPGSISYGVSYSCNSGILDAF